MPISNCRCFGSNTPELTYFCPCQDIDLRTPEQKEAEAKIQAAMDTAVTAADGDEEKAMDAAYAASTAVEQLYGWNSSTTSPSRTWLSAGKETQ